MRFYLLLLCISMLFGIACTIYFYCTWACALLYRLLHMPLTFWFLGDILVMSLYPPKLMAWKLFVLTYPFIGLPFPGSSTRSSSDSFNYAVCRYDSMDIVNFVQDYRMQHTTAYKIQNTISYNRT